MSTCEGDGGWEIEQTGVFGGLVVEELEPPCGIESALL